MRIVTVHPVGPGYLDFVRFLASEPLAQHWQEDADGAHQPGTHYVVVYEWDHRGEIAPAAWAGYRASLIGGRMGLQCCNNYIRRDFRDRPVNFYEFAYRYRHQAVVVPLGLPAETWLFPEPIPLHETDGWVKDASEDGSGDSPVVGGGGETHHWQRLTWHPSPVQ